MFKKNYLLLIESKAAVNGGNEWRNALIISDHRWLSGGRQGAPLYQCIQECLYKPYATLYMMVYFLIRLHCFIHDYNKLKI